jgi:uncharacterized membrane protein YphA (DoxX/SURF4 family)
MCDLLYAIGRVCLPILFFPLGVGKFANVAGTAGARATRGFPAPTAVVYGVRCSRPWPPSWW